MTPPTSLLSRLFHSLLSSHSLSTPRSLFSTTTHNPLTNPTKHWNQFYKHHQSKFFKDRHYLHKDWAPYFTPHVPTTNPNVVLEVGCGVGNSVFPLLKEFPDVFIHACDFSPRAIELVKEHGAFEASRVNAFVCDVTVDDLCETLTPGSVDIVTMFLQ